MTAADRSTALTPAMGVLMPAVFVGLWSTGFIGAKLGLPHAEPLTFLGWRMVFAASLLAVVGGIARAPWPSGRMALHCMLAGLLVHGVYLGGVFEAIFRGMSAGLTALVVSLQPLLTGALAGWLLGEKVSGRQWLGLGLGLAGVGLVLSEKIGFAGFSLEGLICSLAALAGITFGTLYQKRFGGANDLRTGTALQYAACGLVLLGLATTHETMMIDWTGEFLFAFMWLSLILSVVAIAVFYVLIRRGDAARVASLMYLVPPLTAAIAWALFDEQLGLRAMAGMVVVAVGVGLVNRPAR